jgi:hypothetical protein
MRISEMKRAAELCAIVFPVVVCGLALVGLVMGAVEGRVEVIGKGEVAKARSDEPDVAQAPLEFGVLPGLPAGTPVGSVVAWLKNMTNTPALPPEWVECNGQTLDMPASPYNGQAIPDLNGAMQPPARFLRGAIESGGTGGSEQHRHGGFLVNRTPPRNVNVSAWTPEPHVPPYYGVVWVIKVL